MVVILLLLNYYIVKCAIPDYDDASLGVIDIFSKGINGVVFQGQLDNQRVVLKILPDDDDEAKVHKRISSLNINYFPEYIGTYAGGKGYGFLMSQVAAHESLFSFLRSFPNRSVSEIVLRCIVQQVLDAAKVLWTNELIHEDLHGGNILILEETTDVVPSACTDEATNNPNPLHVIKVIDFGLTSVSLTRIDIAYGILKDVGKFCATLSNAPAINFNQLFDEFANESFDLLISGKGDVDVAFDEQSWLKLCTLSKRIRDDWDDIGFEFIDSVPIEVCGMGVVTFARRVYNDFCSGKYEETVLRLLKDFISRPLVLLSDSVEVQHFAKKSFVDTISAEKNVWMRKFFSFLKDSFICDRWKKSYRSNSLNCFKQVENLVSYSARRFLTRIKPVLTDLYGICKEFIEIPLVFDLCMRCVTHEPFLTQGRAECLFMISRVGVSLNTAFPSSRLVARWNKNFNKEFVVFDSQANCRHEEFLIRFLKNRWWLRHHYRKERDLEIFVNESLDGICPGRRIRGNEGSAIAILEELFMSRTSNLSIQDEAICSAHPLLKSTARLLGTDMSISSVYQLVKNFRRSEKSNCTTLISEILNLL